MPLLRIRGAPTLLWVEQKNGAYMVKRRGSSLKLEHFEPLVPRLVDKWRNRTAYTYTIGGATVTRLPIPPKKTIGAINKTITKLNPKIRSQKDLISELSEIREVFRARRSYGWAETKRIKKISRVFSGEYIANRNKRTELQSRLFELRLMRKRWIFLSRKRVNPPGEKEKLKFDASILRLEGDIQKIEKSLKEARKERREILKKWEKVS